MTNKIYKEVVLPSIVISFDLNNPTIQSIESIMKNNVALCEKIYDNPIIVFGLFNGLFNLN
jgi:hypothetical protein